MTTTWAGTGVLLVIVLIAFSIVAGPQLTAATQAVQRVGDSISTGDALAIAGSDVILLTGETHDGSGRAELSMHVVWGTLTDARWPQCDNGKNRFNQAKVEWSAFDPPRMITGQECYLAAMSEDVFQAKVDTFLEENGITHAEADTDTLLDAQWRVLEEWALKQQADN